MADRTLDVVFLPELIRPEMVDRRAIVVIDVLRATTTIITALQNGAAQVIPCGDIETARRTAATFTPRALLGGERGGFKIDGFDLGNSPAEYSSDAVGGRTLVLATTNGTPAMEACRSAESVWIGAFANVQAFVDQLADRPAITLLCAGTDGRVTGEDVLAAGCAVERWHQQSSVWRMNDQATLALGAWQSICGRVDRGESLADILAAMHGGRNLVRNGMRSDIDYCAEIDRARLVPRLDLEQWTITLP